VLRHTRAETTADIYSPIIPGRGRRAEKRSLRRSRTIRRVRRATMPPRFDSPKFPAKPGSKGSKRKKIWWALEDSNL
jgi:hypothetical protein